MHYKHLILSILLFAGLNDCTTHSTNNETVSGRRDESNPATPPVQTDYLALGNEMAKEAQTILAKNLVSAINEGGTEYAVAFCNTRAIPLTDSISREKHAVIRRVSDKFRNPGNRPNDREAAYIKLQQDKMENGQLAEPTLTVVDGKAVGYYPILTNSLCLKCHGKKNDIDAATRDKIRKLYVADRATGYGENELRGLWVVEMDRQ
jgi:hypothetical protein